MAWNKVVRREFLIADWACASTPAGTRTSRSRYPVLVAAERIGVLDRVCYHYRQRRAGAITRTRSERHFEVFDQWHRVFG